MPTAAEELTASGEYAVVNLTRAGLLVELLQLAAAADRPERMIKGPFKVGLLRREDRHLEKATLAVAASGMSKGELTDWMRAHVGNE